MNRHRRRPSPRAVALSYDGDGAPRISAKGEGPVAERIVDIAREHRVPLHSDPDLVHFLARVPLGDEIPEALYLAVAQVLAFAYQVTGKTPGPHHAAEQDPAPGQGDTDPDRERDQDGDGNPPPHEDGDGIPGEEQDPDLDSDPDSDPDPDPDPEAGPERDRQPP